MAKKVAKKAAMPAKNADGAAKKIIGALAAKAIGAGTRPPINDIPTTAMDVSITYNTGSDPQLPVFDLSVVPANTNLMHFSFAAQGRQQGEIDYYDFSVSLIPSNRPDRTGTLTLIAPEVQRERPDFGDDEIVITIITKKKVR